MSIPEGYSLLARVGFVDRGNYSASATYLAGDVVYYNGSTWSALKDNLKGVTPANGASWRYMARGFASEVLSAITAKDTSGLVGNAGASVGAQELMDAIADKVATKLLLKTDLVSQIVNDATKAASMAALYAVNQKVDQQNSDLDAVEAAIATKASISDINPKDWNSLPLSESWAAGSYIYYRNQAGNKQVKMYGGPLNAQTGSYGAVFTLPASMRPTKSIYGICHTSLGERLMYNISGDGVFKIKALSQALTGVTIVADFNY